MLQTHHLISLDSNKKTLFNKRVRERKPFFFCVDFLGEKFEIFDTHQFGKDIFFSFPNIPISPIQSNNSFQFIPNCISYEVFLQAFNQVYKEIRNGNSYLLNLTFQTPISSSLTLKDIFDRTTSKYKIYYPNQWVCFSPETFIRIEGNLIKTYPMKGTIDATKENALQTLLDDEKERAEHYTIVDLMRNDLSRVSEDVTVKQFRYVDLIETAQGSLYQTSSEIIGTLLPDFQSDWATVLEQLLPAGSISGAPKDKTLHIIQETENYTRGYYTGIAGFFDGTLLETCVLIRFIEQANNQLYFKSGGGITSKSHPKEEFEELKQKIYVPIY